MKPRRIAGNRSSTSLTVRLTPDELAVYRLLADRRQKPLADIVRGGLQAACRQTCLCEQGKPTCLKCAASKPSQSQATEKPAAEPRVVPDRYCDQETEQLQREAEQARFAARQARPAPQAESLPVLPPQAEPIADDPLAAGKSKLASLLEGLPK